MVYSILLCARNWTDEGVYIIFIVSAA